ncbi:MAG: hypothetical protein ACREDM_12065 [Methylocella sp.]
MDEGLSPIAADKLIVLAPFLQHKGMMMFVACIAGADDAGSAFLSAVSRQLPYRVIVGFSVWGLVDIMPAPNDPGNVAAAPTAKIPPRGTPRLTPWCDYAKWAYGGKIVRLPAEEQKKRAGKRCANPACQGHTSEHDRCTDWIVDPILKAYNP